MEVDNNINPCKFPKLSYDSKLIMDIDQYKDEEEEVENNKKEVVQNGGVSRFYGWASSRIVRVSRASGGKDRHSKVLTSKGLRDRRVRLSVNTAIQFYDLQDRLGYDQPSKAVEWLLKAAESSISELPPMNTPLFPETPPKQVIDEKSEQLGLELAEIDASGSGAAGAGGSETSRNSGGLSISRSETRIKARERAKGRVKKKENFKEGDSINPKISQATSFTELLNGGRNPNDSNFFKSERIWTPSSSPMDKYFGFLGHNPQAANRQINFSNSIAPPLYAAEHHHHPELQQFSFVTDNNGSNSNSNFTISDFTRGTLQSNASSMLNQFNRFQHIDGTSAFSGGGEAAPENQFLPGFDASLQLFYGDSGGQKGKGKN